MTTYLISCSILFIFVILIIKDLVFVDYYFHMDGVANDHTEENVSISFWNLFLLLVFCFIPIVNIISFILLISLLIGNQIELIYINKENCKENYGMYERYYLIKGRNFITKTVCFSTKQLAHLFIKTYLWIKKICIVIHKNMSKKVF